MNLRSNFWDLHAKCRILTDNIDDQEADDIMDLYTVQAFETPAGVEALILNLKDELEARHGWECTIAITKANKGFEAEEQLVAMNEELSIAKKKLEEAEKNYKREKKQKDE